MQGSIVDRLPNCPVAREAWGSWRLGGEAFRLRRRRPEGGNGRGTPRTDGGRPWCTTGDSAGPAEPLDGRPTGRDRYLPQARATPPGRAGGMGREGMPDCSRAGSWGRHRPRSDPPDGIRSHFVPEKSYIKERATPRPDTRAFFPDIPFEPQRTPVPTASPLVRRETPGIFGPRKGNYESGSGRF